MSQKDLKVRVGADTSLAEKQIDKLQDQNITIAVDVDLNDVKDALKTISGLTSKISNAFGDKFQFSGLKKSIDDIDKKFSQLIKKTSKGISYIDVNPMGLDDLKGNIESITDTLKELNGSKLDLSSFERLEKTLSSIEHIVHSIMTGLDFDKIRSVSQVQKDIDETTKQLEGLSNAQKELQKFEKRLSGKTAKSIFSRIFMNGKVDAFDAEDLSKWLGYLKEYKKLGGDLSKIKIDHIASKLTLPKDVIRSWEQYKNLSEEDFDVKFNKLESFYKDTDVKTLQDIYDLLVMIKHIDHDTFLDDAKISGDMVGAGEKAEQLTTQLSLLNKELDKAQAREHKLNVSLDTGSVEEFTKAITTALQAVGDFNLKIPEDFSFEGLSPESLNSIIGKLEEIAKTIRDIGTLLSTGVDVSNLHIKELGVDVHPQVDKAEFVKQIEDQLNGSVIDVKASVKLSGDTQDSTFQLVDNAMITGAKTEFKNITNDFGRNLKVEISSIKDNLTDVMKSVKYETLFESLRSTLLDIVVQFQNSLNNVSFSKEQTGEIYKLLHEWQEASNILSRTGKDSERAALLNQSTGSVSNSYLYDKETGFSGRILAELNRLSAGVSGEIRELYDTWLHSHPFREELQGLKTIGSDIGFTPEDFEVYRNRYLKQGVANMMVANNGKYTNINWDGISEEIMNKVIRNFKASDIWNNGAFVGKLAQENGIYNFDKQSNQINNAIIKAMQSAGISDAEQRIKVGNIEDLKVDMSALHQEEQKASEEAQELIEVFRQLGTVLDSFSGESFKFGISEESLKGVVDKLNEIADLLKVIGNISVDKNNISSIGYFGLSQTFDNEIQQNLVYLENYKNAVKEIDRLKLEPETDETIQKMKELNDLADYYLSQISVIRSENGHVVSAEMMKFSGSWNESLKQYPYDKAQELYNIASANYGLSTHMEMPEFKFIGDEIASIEAKSESLRLSLAKDLTESNQYVQNLKHGFTALADTTDELKTETSPKWIDALNKDVDKILSKYPELEQFKDKFTYKQAIEFVKTDNWNDFLSTLPQAQRYLESIGYEFKNIDSNNILRDNSTNVGTTGMAYEALQAEELRGKINAVTTAVDLKTRAFQEEEQIVVGTVQREISSLELLDGQLTEIVNTLDKIKTESTGLDFNSLTNVNTDSGLNRLLSDLNEQVKGLDLESLSKLSGAIQGLKTTITTAENLEMVALALKEFKESLSGISVDDNNFLSSINSILSKKDELQNLCKILESSSEKIKEVQNATNKGTGKDSGIGKDTQEDAEKASKAVKKLKDDIESLYGSLRKSIKDRESKNIFGTEHFIDDLMEVSKKYKSIQELRASNKSLISDKDMQSIEEYFAKFKMSAGDFVGNIDQTNKTSEFIEQLNQAETQLESVKAVLDKVKSGEAFTEEDIAKVKEFISQIRNLNSVERDRSNNFADTTKVDKLLGNIADDLRKHSSMTKELREEYELLQNEIKSFGNNLPTDKLKEFESTYANLNRRMKEGQTGLSFFDGIIKKARTMSQNFIAMYFSLYDIIRYIRTGVTYIKDLDTAFTEMRKVSDESTKSLKNFQNESFDIANAVGTTAKQIQNSTADWMGEILVPLYGNI